MAEEKVFYPETIEENPFPGGTEPIVLGQSLPKDTYAPTVSKDSKIRTKRTAVELLGTSLNTRSRKVLQEFELQQSGGFQIGNFQEGLSGDLRITPNGITARDIAGLTTFAIDGTNGDATFKGTLQAGTLIGGDNNVLITDNNGGGLIVLYNNGVPEIVIGEV